MTFFWINIKSCIILCFFLLRIGIVSGQEAGENSLPGNQSGKTKGDAYIHLVMYGQSLSVGHQAYPVISMENVPGNAMIGNQVWINYGNQDISHLNPLVGNIAAEFLSQKEIRSPSAGTIAECPLLGAANHIQLKVSGQQIIATSCGTSGKTIEQLSPESQTKNLYGDFLKTIKKASEIAHSTNSGIECPAIFWMQGEWNYQGYEDGFTAGSKPTGDKSEYKSLLLKLKDHMQDDIRNQYGQKHKPVFITYQTGAQYVKGREQTIGMAQLEAANEQKDVVMAGPIYPMTDRGGHLDPNGYRWYGEMLGKVYVETCVLGKKFKPLQPEEIKVEKSGKVLQIKFFVPHYPMVIDTLTTQRVADFGFEVYLDDQKSKIEKVTVSGDNVLLWMQDQLTGNVEVCYAGQNTSGHGNLRDSDPYQSFYRYVDLDQKNPDGSFLFPRDSTETTLRPKYEPRDPNGKVIYNQHYPLYNFGVSFYYKLPKGETHLKL